MEIAATNPPVWKYQRQFDFAEGVSTIEQRPNLLSDTAPRLLSDEQVRTFLATGCLTLQPDLPAEFHREMYAGLSGSSGTTTTTTPATIFFRSYPSSSSCSTIRSSRGPSRACSARGT